MLPDSQSYVKIIKNIYQGRVLVDTVTTLLYLTSYVNPYYLVNTLVLRHQDPVLT